jgi:uncharacterized protein (DUF2141 family)
MVMLFASETAYARRDPLRRLRIEAGEGNLVAMFDRLEPGTYAVIVFHDLDGDGRLTMNPFGVPTEPFAFSNNARGNMGPASWEQASFTVRADTTHSIEIR